MKIAQDPRSANDKAVNALYGADEMNALRAFFLQHRHLAIFVVMAALCMKMVVPAGFMIGQNSKVLTVQLCAESLGHAVTAKIAIPMKGETSDSTGKQGKGDCPFSSLSMASTTGADPALLGLALAFILALGFSPVRVSYPERLSYLRPPLRGPPALF